MYRIWTDRGAKAWVLGFLSILTLILLGGCAASKDELLPHGERDMLDVWQQETGGGNASLAGRRLLDARQGLRRSLTESDVQAAPGLASAYTRDAAREIHRQFHRLPNPDLVMYVFPHLAGSDPVPVPGYSTVFPLYRRAPYALPGERLEAY
jgi:conjugative transfer region lipoprotein (TIGR03751 family)